jgi:hypothetical protein
LDLSLFLIVLSRKNIKFFLANGLLGIETIQFSGVYECQISTQPVKSFAVRLNVVGKLK